MKKLTEQGHTFLSLSYFKGFGIKCFYQNKQLSCIELPLVWYKRGYNFQQKLKERNIIRKSFLVPLLIRLVE